MATPLSPHGGAQTKRYTPTVPQQQLQQLLDRAKSSKQPNDANAFKNAIQSELKAFDDYCAQTYNVFYQRLFGVIKNFGTPALNPKAAETECDQLSAGITEFNTLIGTQFRLYKKLLTKFEKATGGDPASAEAVLLNMAFSRIGFGDLVTMISDIYHSLRGILKLFPPRPDPSAFNQGSHKYFVRLEDVTKLKLAIAKYMPVLRPSRQQGVVMGQPGGDRRVSGFQHLNNGYDGGGEGDGLYQTVIFLDNENLETYHDKVFKKDGSTLVKVRWQGEEGGPCTFEVSTPHSSLLQSANLKERFEIPYNRVQDFLAGRLTAQQYVDGLKASPEFSSKNIREILSLAEMVQKKLKSTGIHPAIRAIFHRTTFQFSDFAAIRIYVDTTIHISKEPKDAGKGRWCRDLSQPIPPGDALMFPLATLEIKTFGISSLPPWLSKLLDSGYIVDSSKFNKFIHGTAALTPAKTQVLPSWFQLPFVHLPGQPLVNWYCSPSIPLEKPDTSAPTGGAGGKFRTRGRSSRFGEEDFASGTESVEMQPLVSKPPPSQPPALPPPAQPAPPPTQPAPPRYDPVKPTPAPAPTVYASEKPTLVQRMKALFTGKQVQATRTGLTPLLPMIRVEPKTYFANERTLIAWSNVVVWIAFAGVGLYTFAPNPVAQGFGIGLLGISILFMAYAFGLYIWRRRAIVSRSVDGRYDDPWGPTILVIILIAYLIVALLFQYLYVPPILPTDVPPLVVSRSWRLAVLPGSANPDAVWSQITQRGGFPFSGSLSAVTSAQQTYYDHTPSCALYRNGFRLRQHVNASGSYVFLSFVWPDLATVRLIDRVRTQRLFYNASENVMMPDLFMQERYEALPVSSAAFPRLQSVQRYFPNFPLWINILPSLWNVSLTPVNGLTSTHDTYGPGEVDLGNPRRTGKIFMDVWRDGGGTVLYAMLRLEVLYQETRDPILSIEISNGQALFNALAQIAAVNGTATADPLPVLYGNFCP